MLGEKFIQRHMCDTYTFNIYISQTKLLNLKETFHHFSSAGKKLSPVSHINSPLAGFSK